MAYFTPFVDAAGLHLPQFSDILSYYTGNAQSIYGSDIYLDNDSADGQILNILALAANDAMQSVQLAYSNRAPAEAIGAALDGLFKLNGGTRNQPTYSTCQVTLAGSPNLPIVNGIVQDINNYYWSLPASVTLDNTGAATVTATCQTIGAITALAGDINIISTPTQGWTSVTNAVAAVSGNAVEQDSSVRVRQQNSVALPSLTRFQGTAARLLALSGVTRMIGFENPTGSTTTDPNGLGLPAHSITFVVEGDTDTNVAQAIWSNTNGSGCYTNGTTTIDITDPIYGNQSNVSFYRPTYVPIGVTLGITKLAGYTTATGAAIQNAIVTFLNAFQIYESISFMAIGGAAMSVMPNLAVPLFKVESVTIGTNTATGATITSAGTGYTTATGLPVAGGNGNGATVDITATSGAITAVSFATGGQGYQVGDVLNIVQTGGSNGTITITSISAQSAADITIDFNQVVQGVSTNVTVNVS